MTKGQNDSKVLEITNGWKFPFLFQKSACPVHNNNAKITLWWAQKHHTQKYVLRETHWNMIHSSNLFYQQLPQKDRKDVNARKSWIFWLHKSRKAVYTDTVAQSVVVCFTKSLNSDRCPSIIEPAVKKKTIVKDGWRGELSKKNHKGCPKPSNLSALSIILCGNYWKCRKDK